MIESVDAKDRLIVALDVDSKEKAMAIVDDLDAVASFFKVGYQLFIAEGIGFIRELIDDGKKVFLDLKMDDVEETIKLAVGVISRAGPEFLTIHGGPATVRAAIEGRGDMLAPKILFLTFLSSLNEKDLKEMTGADINLDRYIENRTRLAIEAGTDGIIASGASVARIRAAFKNENPIIVTPGIRPAGAAKQDHKRSFTPFEAIMAGSDYLVVGRPIRDAANRKEMAQRIIDDIDKALRQTTG